MTMQRKIQEVNHTIQDTGQQVYVCIPLPYCLVSSAQSQVLRLCSVQLMQSAAELHHARHIQRNILSTVEALGLCVPGE